jgi:hypothetical protein
LFEAIPCCPFLKSPIRSAPFFLRLAFLKSPIPICSTP